jgi:CCR4-NOT transcription complex subunit 6
MYAQNHGSSQYLMNGGSHQRHGVQINMGKPFQQQHAHHGQHHHQDPGHAHAGNYAHHQHSHSGSGLSNPTGHFGAGHMQNGAQGASYNTPSKPPNEHWASQLQLAQQCRDNSVSHSYARHVHGMSKNAVASTASMLSAESITEERQRPSAEDPAVKPQGISFTELDISGQHIARYSPGIFNYNFLTKLYLNNNKLTYLPGEVGKLRSLKVLDLSLNAIRELPPQIGMLVNLKELLLVDNQLESLPFELGNLYQCSMLAIEGNPLNEELKNVVIEHGSSELIRMLRDNAPGMFNAPGFFVSANPMSRSDTAQRAGLDRY